MFRKRKSATTELEQAEVLEAFTRQLEGKSLTRTEHERLAEEPGRSVESLKQVLALIHENREAVCDTTPPPGALQRVEAALMNAIHHGRPVDLPHAGVTAAAYGREPLGSDSELIQVEYDIADSPPDARGRSVAVGLRLLRDGEVTEERRIVLPAVTIGSATTATLAFPQASSVSPLHVQLSAVVGEIFLQDLQSQHGTRLNNHLLHGRYPIETGDSLTLGDLTFRVARIEPHVEGLLLVLQEMTDEEPGTLHRLVVPEVTLGRSNVATLQLADLSRRLSRLHAQMDAIDGRLYLTDLNSSNGTYVDGERIRRRTRVKTGSLIRLGGVHVQVATIHVLEGN